jgi:winged helix DNA-binding protein
MAERVLSTRELNRAVLARQLLLERSPLPIARAVEQVAGLQTQYAPSAYIALWSRLRDFQRESLTKALEQKRVVQATLMRSTIHIVSARDFPLFASGVTQGRREWWLRVVRHQADGLDMDKVARVFRKRLAEGPTRATELRELLSTEGIPPIAWSGAPHWIDMVRVPPSGTWAQRRADLYGLADSWLGPGRPIEADGLQHLVRRYLGGFGPAALNDIADWAGVARATLIPVVQRLGLRRFRTERRTELLDVAGAPLPAADTPAPVRFLPTWDATLLVHARRALILPERFRPLVFHTKTPHSVPTFTVDGSVAGTWRYEGGRIQLKPFEPLPKAAMRDLESEAARLAEFHAD